MRLVILAKTEPPPKSVWADPDQTARGEWSEIYEGVTNWFCFSNGLRKNHDLDIIIGSKTLHIRGEHIRYLAPPLRSAASLIWHGYNKKQVGISLTDNLNIEAYQEPYYTFSEYNDTFKVTEINEDGTLFLNPDKELQDKLDLTHVVRIPTLGQFNSQKLVWFLYR